MPFTLFKGVFTPEFGRPDGDSLRFVPDNPQPLQGLRRRGFPPKINQTNGSIQLRYEAIDTMEKSALAAFADEATRSNLDLAGTNNGANQARGYIYTNQIGPHGRPIAFVFSGEIDEDDNSEKFLTADDVESSINVQQLALGHAYPLFYDTLFSDLREKCTQVALAARQEAQPGSMLASDKTLTGADWAGSAANMDPIYPKLWRRIDEYLDDETLFDEEQPFSNLKQWIEIEKPERVFVLSDNKFTGFDDLVETTDTTVKLLADPLDIIVVSV